MSYHDKYHQRDRIDKYLKNKEKEEAYLLTILKNEEKAVKDFNDLLIKFKSTDPDKLSYKKYIELLEKLEEADSKLKQCRHHIAYIMIHLKDESGLTDSHTKEFRKELDVLKGDFMNRHFGKEKKDE